MSNTVKSSAPKLLVIELNEFNPALLREASTQMPLPNLNRILSMQHADTTTADEVEHQGLDPWVQWVGVHTGRPAADHGIRRLGMTAVQAAPQIWQVAGQHGLRWGVWGAMNAPKGNSPGCEFFMPDPWSFEEKASPAELNDLLALPRYAATNYLELSIGDAFKAALRTARFFLPPSRWALAARAATEFIRASGQAGVNVHTFTTLFDYLSVLYFTQLRRTRRPDLSLIFLNHIAHLQHQFWVEDGKLDRNMALGLRLSDQMMGLLLEDAAEDEGVLVANVMRQKKVAGQGYFVYRQKQPQRAIEAFGIGGGRVEQLMTHDAHIIFRNEKDADHAERVLRACRLSDGHDVFYVEREGPLHLFYQLSFDHEVKEGVHLDTPNGAIPFDQVFELICERTGAHEQGGDVFFRGVDVPAKLHNHELFDVMAAHLGCHDQEARRLAAA
ncbi:MAG TPA: hypothetical protein VGB62_00325 [Allosphingosinicella sp.]|jgi:hypothetical protein